MSDQELNDLLKSFDNPNHCYQQRLVDAIRLLVKERDEARREVLMNEANHLPTMSDPFREAKRRGWDCLEPRKPWDCHKDYK